MLIQLAFIIIYKIRAKDSTLINYKIWTSPSEKRVTITITDPTLISMWKIYIGNYRAHISVHAYIMLLR